MPGGARISDEAVGRNRESARARYHKDKDRIKKVKKQYEEHKFNSRRFIGWDGEGYNAYIAASDGTITIDHRYMLFGASTGDYIQGINLSTEDCLDLILRVESENPDAYHVGFSFEYDVNMMLKDVKWRGLAILKECGSCRVTANGTRKRVEHVPHKWVRVSSKGVSATIFDCFGFFHCGYLPALKKYGIGNDAIWERIAAGKAGRGHFTFADIEDVKAYFMDELALLPPLMDSIRTAAYDGGYRINEWHGPGALAAYLLRDRGAIRWHSNRKKTPNEVMYAIRAAYAGGRFTPSLCGFYLGDIYTADINSAYVYAISLLPRMDNGRWVRQSPGSIDTRNLPRFGLFHIEFDAGSEFANGAKRTGLPEPPYPLFHRSKNGILRWPRKTQGWYWTPEAELVLGSKDARVLEAWFFNDDGTHPFRFVNDAYDRRVILQEANDPAEKAYKWSLAAMYGAFARRVGWNKATRKPPASHELAWAGFITSWCRANVFLPAYKAWATGKTRGLISIDTDGITATVPFDPETLCNGVGKGLGQWKLEKYTGILQWQNGIYWLRNSKGEWIDPKSRGIPKGTIPFAAALEAIQKMDYSNHPFTHPKLTITRTRFVGYRQAIRGQFPKWRQWLTEPVEVMMGGTPNGKAWHFYALCSACRAKKKGVNLAPTDIRGLHTICNTSIDTLNSQPHRLPWLEDQPDLRADFKEDLIPIVRDEDI